LAFRSLAKADICLKLKSLMMSASIQVQSGDL
jgi:hypothetical protein